MRVIALNIKEKKEINVNVNNCHYFYFYIFVSLSFLLYTFYSGTPARDSIESGRIGRVGDRKRQIRGCVKGVAEGEWRHSAGRVGGLEGSKGKAEEIGKRGRK